MSTVAEQLRRAREEQSLSVYQVADVTKIRTDHIRALEEGKYDIFSATIYVRGFVRSYAAMLKLDVNQVLSDLDSELSQNKKFSAPPSLTGDHEGPVDFCMFQLSKINWRIGLPVLVLILVAVLAMSGLTAWQNHQAKDPLADLGPGLYQPPEKENPGEILPLPED